MISHLFKVGNVGNALRRSSAPDSVDGIQHGRVLALRNRKTEPKRIAG
jgi:hypothetical protein